MPEPTRSVSTEHRSNPEPVVHLDAETRIPIGISTPCAATTIASLGFPGLSVVRVPCGNLAGHEGPHVYHVEWTTPIGGDSDGE